MDKKSSSFSPIGSIVEQCVKNPKSPPLFRLMDLVHHWPDIVGDWVSEHAFPIRLKGGILTIQAQSSSWANELQLMSPKLLKTMQETCPKLGIKKVRFVEIGRAHV